MCRVVGGTAVPLLLLVVTVVVCTDEMDCFKLEIEFCRAVIWSPVPWDWSTTTTIVPASITITITRAAAAVDMARLFVLRFIFQPERRSKIMKTRVQLNT